MLRSNSGAAVGDRRHPGELIDQAVDGCHRFLFERENRFQFLLGLFERRFFGFAGVAEFFQRSFDLARRSVVLDGILQGFQFGTGRASKTSPSAAGAVVSTTAATLAPATPSAAEPEHRTLGLEHLLNPAFEDIPFSIVGYTHLFMDALHPSLHELCGIETTATAAWLSHCRVGSCAQQGRHSGHH